MRYIWEYEDIIQEVVDEFCAQNVSDVVDGEAEYSLTPADSDEGPAWSVEVAVPTQGEDLWIGFTLGVEAGEDEEGEITYVEDVEAVKTLIDPDGTQTYMTWDDESSQWEPYVPDDKDE